MDDSVIPTRRRTVTGTDLDGDRVTLVFCIARKLYRCPGCRGSVDVGAEHVLLRRVRTAGDSFHQHWHADCARAVGRELRDVRITPA